MDINIFVQVGFVVLAGLAAKNAILIVEFARDRQQEGVSTFHAAARSRDGAAASYPHDEFCVHPGCVPAGHFAWGRGRDTPAH